MSSKKKKGGDSLSTLDGGFAASKFTARQRSAEENPTGEFQDCNLPAEKIETLTTSGTSRSLAVSHQSEFSCQGIRHVYTDEAMALRFLKKLYSPRSSVFKLRSDRQSYETTSNFDICIKGWKSWYK